MHVCVRVCLFVCEGVHACVCVNEGVCFSIVPGF